MDNSTGKQAPKSSLTLKVIYGGAKGFSATSTLVMGEKDAVLIDVPIILSQAHRVVAEILESKRNLKYIYITHGHPDHFFSASVFVQAFPNAQLIAIPQVCKDVALSIPERLKFWSDMLGSDCPRNLVVPNPYEGSFIELEGEKLEILGPMVGDHKAVTAIYIPVLDAIIGSDIVFSGIHLFMAHHVTPEARKGWLKSIEYMMFLKPKIVVAGHKQAHMSDGPESLQYCHDYLIAFEQILAQSNSSTELIVAIQDRFPEVQDMMDGFVLPRSARLADKAP
ncbi:MAG: MBL fold metallo-hydrolase [Chloroflexi bacterium]|jgi:glyoxylase-like metal-dependent hydrolase (beta-lactamase superfamily II)|nr:MBL fold metallo-hydrolase [Chloroflexota bacterium]MBT7082563.1 MBL fold metallo-hydrolase [Chloroflexota bacterium]MBT7289108.1 MBL fold metallo-hydrolase [Chloroflexota bacterium]